MARAIAEVRIETRIIADRLDKAELGDVVTYSELSALIGRDIQEVYHLTVTARNQMLAIKKYFQAVPGVGFLRCTDKQKVASGSAYLGKMRKAGGRGARITTSVDDYDAMDRADQVRHNAQLSLFLTMRAMSTPGKVKAIEARVSEAQQRLSVKSTLDAIAGSKKARTDKKANGLSSQRLPVEIK